MSENLMRKTVIKQASYFFLVIYIQEQCYKNITFQQYFIVNESCNFKFVHYSICEDINLTM